MKHKSLEIDSQDRKVVRYTPEEWYALQIKLDAFEPMRFALERALEYLEAREDADHNGISFVANEAMSIAIDVRAALAFADKEGTE